MTEKVNEADHWKEKTCRYEAHLEEIKGMKENSYASITQSRVRHVQEEKQIVENELTFKAHQVDDWKAKCISLERVIGNFRII